MNDQQYASHCRTLLADFAAALCRRTQSLTGDDTLRGLAEDFQRLATDPEADLYVQAAALIDRLFTTYPDFAPTFPQELLWFLAGTACISCQTRKSVLYQQLDELRSQAGAAGQILTCARPKLSC